MAFDCWTNEGDREASPEIPRRRSNAPLELACGRYTHGPYLKKCRWWVYIACDRHIYICSWISSNCNERFNQQRMIRSIRKIRTTVNAASRSQNSLDYVLYSQICISNKYTMYFGELENICTMNIEYICLCWIISHSACIHFLSNDI